MNSWIRESIFYQCYTLGFCGVLEPSRMYEEENRLTKIKKWIPHLKEMNVNAIYFAPIFESSYHGYDTKDYYQSWSGCYDLVKLNLKNQEVLDHLLHAVGAWIDEFYIDGLRLDATDSIDFEFFKALKKFTETKKDDFWLMGEVIHRDYNKW